MEKLIPQLNWPAEGNERVAQDIHIHACKREICLQRQIINEALDEAKVCYYTKMNMHGKELKVLERTVHS